MAEERRYAVITPYYKEERAVLERCMASVRAQTVKADHVLVADGFPQAWLDEEPVRHLKLDSAHGDYGNVARGIAALLMAGEGYNGIGFLDADNWYEPNHVEACVRAGGGEVPADIVWAKRRYVRPDGSPLPAAEDEGHVDTNCFWFQRGSYHVLHYWVTMPRELSRFGDRVFQRLVRERSLGIAQTGRPTVNYLCLWESVYQRIGETPPPGAKPNLPQLDLAAWHQSLSPAQRRTVVRLTGTDIFTLAGKRA
jgi:glycosyltransferase involved in cell wall biosynthesis